MLVMGARGATGYVLGRGAGSAFTPLSIAGCQCWFDASQLTGLNDGDAIATWTDASGNGRDATQADAARKPIHKTNIIGGKPVARFDGGDTMALAAALSVEDHTIFVVFAPAATITASSAGTWLLQGGTIGASTNRADVILGSVSGNLTNERLSWLAITGIPAEVYGYAKNNANISGTQILALRWNGTAAAMRLNGADALTATSSVGGFNAAGRPTHYQYIGMRSTLTDGFNGDIAEIIVYASALSDANRQAVEAYLSAKYGIALA